MASKTIAVKEPTWEKLKILLKKRHARDLDELINMLVQKSEELPPTMFGADRGLKYTQKEHEDFATDNHL